MQIHPKKREISLTSVFGTAINQPRYTKKDGDFPLYPHSEDSKITLKRPEGWYKTALTTFNSPSNIRTVCLSIDGANMFYWAKPIKGGRPTPNLTASGDYTLDKSGKAGIRQKLDSNLYTFSNTGLQSLVNPVVLSNIEELWITPEIFNTPRYMNFYNQLNNLQPGQVAGIDFLSAILEAEISTPSRPRTIADTFPLLRAIVVVKTPPNSQVLDFHRLASRDRQVSQRLDELFPNQRRAVGEAAPILQELAQQTGYGFAVEPILTGSILKFSLGSYKYDAQVLSGLRDKIVNKYTLKKTAIEDKKAMPKEEKSEKEPDSIPNIDTDTAPEDEESLLEVIKALEQESTSTSAIKKTLFTLKVIRPDYFARQIPRLPKDMLEKYKDAL